tara:strand:- start:922 stop:1293 length:372 start_codon:yes stop_codon:yes gene_type:complete
MTDNNKLIEDVLGGLKVPKKQTRQQKKSMKRSEKNIKKNLYDDVLKPLKNSGGGTADTKKGSTDFGMLSVKYGIDENPDETRADFIAGATKGKKPKTADAGTGKFLVKGMGVAIRGGLTKGSS